MEAGHGADPYVDRSSGDQVRSRDDRAARNRSFARRLAPPQQDLAHCLREPLLRSLEVARSGRLTVLIGPPGFGKTTALSQWHADLSARDVCVAWYSASEIDREPVRFLRMLVLAMEAGGIEPGPPARRSAEGGSANTLLDGILVGLEKIDVPIVFIVDDYDRVEHEAISRLLAELLELLPDNVHLVLSTRRKPMLPVSTFRARVGVRLIEPAELKLSMNELAVALALSPEAPEIQRIHAQTEGWPVAVQLFRLWLDRAMRQTEMVPFGGQASEVADYLTEQVVSTLPAEQQALLLSLSIVEQVEPSLADAIRDKRDSAAMLEAISQLLPSLVQKTISGGETAYRVHPLLSDYARGKLALLPGRAGRLHQRAAVWLAAHDRHADAIRHAVASKNEGFLRDLLDRLPYFTIFLAYGVGELRATIREIPVAMRDINPRARLLNALTLFKEGFFREADAMLRAVNAELADQASMTSVEARALRLLFDCYLHGTRSSYQEHVAWLRENAPPDPLLLAWRENALLLFEQVAGDLDAATITLERTRCAYRAIEEPNFAIEDVQLHEMLIDLARGELRQVRTRISAFNDGVDGSRGSRSFHAMIQIIAAHIAHETSYRTQAAEGMRLAIAQCSPGEPWFDFYALTLPVLVDATFRRHGLVGALQELEAAKSAYSRLGLCCMDGIILATTLLCHARARSTAALLALESACRAQLREPEFGAIPWREQDVLRCALAMSALTRGDAGGAHAIGLALYDDAIRGGRIPSAIRGMSLVVLALAESDRTAALASLREALRLALPEGQVAAFAENAGALAPLLRELLTWETSRPIVLHASKVMRVIDAEIALAGGNPLSYREHEIVSHLADGASNKLIARRLSVTENTIKFHLKNVYAKLGVSTRQEAVDRAATILRM